MAGTDPTRKISVCVYCGSQPGNDPKYTETAYMVGQMLAAQSKRLVYGGGNRGLMGAVARGTLEAGGSVLGIIPEFLKSLEQSESSGLLPDVDLITVPDMHTRKKRMFDEADAFIALPGGIGTLEELVEVLTWAQLKQHTKPIILFDINGFWSCFADQLSRMAQSGFLHNVENARPGIVSSTDQLEELLLNMDHE